MTTVLYAFALFFIIEGLVYAVAPDYLKMLLEVLQKTPEWKQRVFGLIIVTTGLILIWVARYI